MTAHLHPETIEAPSPLRTLRALMPDRRLSLPEAIQVARQQAAELRRLLGVHSDRFPIEALATIPRIKIDYVNDIPILCVALWTGIEWHIQVRADESAPHQRFAVLHEFKTILDHPVYSADPDEPYQRSEQQVVANHFADYVLMPDDQLRQANSDSADHPQLAARFGVGPAHILHRLTDLNATNHTNPLPANQPRGGTL